MELDARGGAVFVAVLKVDRVEAEGRSSGRLSDREVAPMYDETDDGDGA